MERERMVLVDRMWLEPAHDAVPAVIRGIVHGPLPTKSNQRQIVYVKGRPMVIKSKDARVFEERFRIVVKSCPMPGLPWTGATSKDTLKKGLPKFYLTAHVYQEHLNRDLDIELLADVLQKTGIINNDRALWGKLSMRYVDEANPRTEFAIGTQIDLLA